MEEPPSQNWRRFTRLRPDRKRIKRSAKKIEVATLKHAHTFIIRRWDNVKDVRQFALSWVVLIGLLIAVSGLQMLAYQRAFSQVVPVSGGTFAEGVAGPLETINPLFASTSAEKSASALVFSGLLSYDKQNSLRGEVASSWRIEKEGRRYVVDMKQNVTWHDGAPVTAEDVVFTVGLMKNKLTNADSSLYNSWSGIIVTKLSQYSVAFDLPAPNAPFPHALTFGLIPKHLLNDIRPESLREATFSRSPIGSGPFVFNRLQLIDPDQDRVVLYLNANLKYVRGAPKLDRFQLHVYKDAERIKTAFMTSEINAATGLSSSDLAHIKEANPNAILPNTSIYDGLYALLRTDSPILQDIKVREALRLGTNRNAIIAKLQGNGELLDGPLLPEHFASLKNKKQPAFDSKAAGEKLDQAGWALQNNKRIKDGQLLTLTVVASRTGDYPVILEEITAQWKALGITLDTQLVAPETIQQNVVIPRAYDVLINDLVLGVDPDVYAYWHSSQAGPRGLNLSNYKSQIADEALQSAHSRSETNLRQPKYETFVDTWLKDVPAIALYKPYLSYVTTATAVTMPINSIVADREGRYRNIEYWTIDKATNYKTP
ncbi:hypothetical protein H7Y40_02270 [Pedobacter sp.]|nr:hypothetical protein [Candidatus Saccharibacteria bacterium]